MSKIYLFKGFTFSALFLSSIVAFGQDEPVKDSLKNLQEVSVVGSRNKNRVSTDTPVPVDIISIGAQSAATPQTDLTQILNYAAPSFTSNTTTVADGTDHIDPAQLRGLGPDQVLVLLNGKRRHTSALVNINGTPGRGSVGTDLNAIPAFAIDRLEVLRDGASAQYGSDAIAGVINVVMKKNTKKLAAAITTGGFLSSAANDHDGGFDGAKVQLDLNWGTSLGGDKGFINLTGSLANREITSRAKDATGNIFNAFNAIEQRASENGTNLASLFGNSNNSGNTALLLSTIKSNASQVNYFTSTQQLNIANANTIAAMRTALNFDVTDNELAYRGLERSDFNMRVGQSKLKSGQFFLNSEYKFGENAKGYLFGGFSYRDGNSAGFFRRPTQSNTSTSIYLNGFLPEIGTKIYDISLAGGVKGKITDNLDFDISNTFGNNQLNYSVLNTANATATKGQTEFDAGGLAFSQNTMNFDFSTKADVLQGLNIAFGAEVRLELFKIKAGEESSWASYDIFGNIINGSTLAINRPTDFFGTARSGGSQVFPGLRPENQKTSNRLSEALYVDTELDVTKNWLVSAALRFENYSDFGSTLNYKVATRLKINDNFSLRGAYATGFRAPSLHQINYESTATQFVSGVPFEIGTFANDSEIASQLGIPTLKEEESRSVSAGFTGKIPSLNITFTVDGYYTQIFDKVVITDQFARPSGTFATGSSQAQLQGLFDAANATAATFFANAIDSEARGIEGVITHKAKFGNIKLSSDLAVTYSKMNRIGDIYASDILIANNQINNYYSERSRVFLEEAVPRFKASLNNNLTFGNFNFFLRNVYFGEVTDPNIGDTNNDGYVDGSIINNVFVETEHQTMSGNIVTDLSIGYEFSKMFKLTIGANNLLDIYPGENKQPHTAFRASADGVYRYFKTGDTSTPTGILAGPDSGVNPATSLPADYVRGVSTIDLTSANQFVYSRNVSQFGQNGGFVFARINLTF